MWRLSAIARSRPKKSGGGGVVRAGMRRNRTAAAPCADRKGPMPGPHPRTDARRWFRASPRSGAERYGGIAAAVDRNFDPDDPDDIPDFLDNEDFARMVRDVGDGNDDDDEEEARERYRLRQEKVNDELDSRKGRPWRDPWDIKEELWMQSDTSSDGLPDWSPSYVSRVSQERLQVLSAEDGKGISTLDEIAELSLPASDAELHPSRKAKTYAAYRKRRHYEMVRDCVAALAKDRVAGILERAAASDGDRDDWSDAVDALFEELQEEAKVDPSMDILSKHPAFPSWVDRGLEDFLRASEKEALQQKDDQQRKESPSTPASTEGDDAASAGDGDDTDSAGEASGGEPTTTSSSWRAETPVFMDCYDSSEATASSSGPMVPGILAPLAPHKHGGPGKMVEEWELSAHSTTKRIMLRESTQVIARALLNEKAPKVYVHGQRGVGKSTALASIVASARHSGAIVFYLPDGDRLRKNGFFVSPSTHPDRKGFFDLQDLSQEALTQLVESHGAAEQMEGMVADRDTLKLYFKETHLKKLDEFRDGLENGSGSNDDDDDESISLLDLVAYAQDNKKHAPMCYSVVLNRLMNQTEKRFIIVLDEFNCLFDRGRYFHMAYDKDVRRAIPYDKINLFEPILAALDLTAKTVEEEEDEAHAASLDDAGTAKATTFETAHTAVVVATTESHAVSNEVTSRLTACAQRRSAATIRVEIPRFTSLEADHVLANFEATGIGKLRLDRGDTLLNPQEVEYLKMASGSIGQKLLDVSIF